MYSTVIYLKIKFIKQIPNPIEYFKPYRSFMEEEMVGEFLKTKKFGVQNKFLTLKQGICLLL